jgi:hypothetical protein
MVECLVIEIDVNNFQDSIQTALTAAEITADQFLQAVVLKEESKNNTVKIIIFYELV